MRYKIYRNLNNGLLSIMDVDSRLVSGHAERVVMQSARFLINASGKLRALRTGTRNVHAFIEGEIVSTTGFQSFRGRQIEMEGERQPSQPSSHGRLEIHYKPFLDLGFYYSDGDKIVEIREAIHAEITSLGKIYATD